MNWIPNIFRRGKPYDDLSEEVRLHIEERAEQLLGEGMSAEEAQRKARVAFGNRTAVEERSREVWQWPTLESIWADLRFALRQLRKSPGFTIAAVSTLALAIGANAVVFGVLNALILRPLNVPQAESLFVLKHGNDVGSHSYPDYLDLRRRNRSLDDIAAWAISQAGLDAGKDPSNVWEYETSGNYFDTLRIQPYLGRFFHASDEHGPNSAPYVVLSYAYWHSHFQDDRGVVGRVVRLNKHPITILGVAPPGFQGTVLFFASDIFVPIVNHEQLSGEKILNARGNHWMFELVGHLKPGVTPAQATADLNSVDSYLKRSYPKEEGNEPYTLARPGLHGDYLNGPTRAFLTGLMLLSGLILLAACANLGSLFAARAADRSREVALRLALGSSRNRILRQLFTESVVLSLAGGVAGLVVSILLLRWLSVWRPVPQFPLHVPVSPDANVYLAALVLALAFVSPEAANATAPCTLNQTNPSVTVCAPALNALVQSLVHVVAGSTDSNQVTAMQVYVDNKLVYQANAPTAETFVSLAVGYHLITVQGWDSTGATFKSNVRVAMQPPCALNSTNRTVTICSLVSGSVVSQPFHVVAAATDSSPVKSMTLLIDGVSKGSNTNTFKNTKTDRFRQLNPRIPSCSTGTSGHENFCPDRHQNKIPRPRTS